MVSEGRESYSQELDNEIGSYADALRCMVMQHIINSHGSINQIDIEDVEVT